MWGRLQQMWLTPPATASSSAVATTTTTATRVPSTAALKTALQRVCSAMSKPPLQQQCVVVLGWIVAHPSHTRLLTSCPSRLGHVHARCRGDVSSMWIAIAPLMVPLWKAALLELGLPPTARGFAQLQVAAYAQVLCEAVGGARLNLSLKQSLTRCCFLPLLPPFHRRMMTL